MRALAFATLVWLSWLVLPAAGCNRAAEENFKQGWREHRCGSEFDVTDVASTVVKCWSSPHLCVATVVNLLREVVGDAVDTDMAYKMIVDNMEVTLKDGVTAKAALLTATQCKHCPTSFFCWPRPNRFRICTAYSKISQDPPDSPLECHTIKNKCGTDVYVAYGFKSGRDWVTEAWWRVSRGSEHKTCFKRGRYLYAHFDFVGDSSDSQSDANFNIGDDGSFCVSNSETTIAERETSPKFHDRNSGATANTCSGLPGAEFKGFEMIDDGGFSSSTLSSSCPGRNLRNGALEVGRRERLVLNESVKGLNVSHVSNHSPLVVLAYEGTWFVQPPEGRPAK
ncbi:unnamed protein product [Effrenium voratum]|nr:unnamed protein product [Effrenium voratum]